MSEFKHPPALAEFLRTAARLESLLGEYGSVKKARGIPAAAADRFNLISVEVRRGWDSSVDQKAVDEAKAMHTRCRAEAYVEAESVRDERLRAIADEITSIRGNLAAIATRCAIELGGTAKDLRFEAEHGRP